MGGGRASREVAREEVGGGRGGGGGGGGAPPSAGVTLGSAKDLPPRERRLVAARGPGGAQGAPRAAEARRPLWPGPPLPSRRYAGIPTSLSEAYSGPGRGARWRREEGPARSDRLPSDSLTQCNKIQFNLLFTGFRDWDGRAISLKFYADEL